MADEPNTQNEQPEQTLASEEGPNITAETALQDAIDDHSTHRITAEIRQEANAENSAAEAAGGPVTGEVAQSGDAPTPQRTEASDKAAKSSGPAPKPAGAPKAPAVSKPASSPKVTAEQRMYAAAAEMIAAAKAFYESSENPLGNRLDVLQPPAGGYYLRFNDGFSHLLIAR